MCRRLVVHTVLGSFVVVYGMEYSSWELEILVSAVPRYLIMYINLLCAYLFDTYLPRYIVNVYSLPGIKCETAT